jgi:hypothetical protein
MKSRVNWSKRAAHGQVSIHSSTVSGSKPAGLGLSSVYHRDAVNDQGSEDSRPISDQGI